MDLLSGRLYIESQLIYFIMYYGLSNLKRSVLLKLNWLFALEVFSGDLKMEPESTQENSLDGLVIVKIINEFYNFYYFF